MLEDFSNYSDSDISLLTQLDSNSLATLEYDIQKNFRTISKKYLKARVARIEYIIACMDQQMKIFNENEKLWQKAYLEETQAIEDLKVNTENFILLGSSSRKSARRNLDSFKLEMDLVNNNIICPLEYKSSFDIKADNEGVKRIPFEKELKSIIEPYQRDLLRILKEKEYHDKLLESNMRANQKIIWKQYYTGLKRKKSQLLNKTYEELEELCNEHQSLRESHISCSLWNYYYRTLISPLQLKRSYDETADNSLLLNDHDHHYGSDNHYYKKNRIELTQIKNSILSKLRSTSSQKGTKICEGLSKDEIESDLFSMKNVKINEAGDSGQADDKIVDMLDETPINHTDLDQLKKNLLEEKYKKILEMPVSIILTEKDYKIQFGQPNGKQSANELKLPQLPPFEVFCKNEFAPIQQ